MSLLLFFFQFGNMCIIRKNTQTHAKENTSAKEHGTVSNRTRHPPGNGNTRHR